MSLMVSPLVVMEISGSACQIIYGSGIVYSICEDDDDHVVADVSYL